MPVELPAGVQLPAGVDATVNSLTVAAGEPGIDTATAGVLEVGGDNATTVEIGKGNVVVDASGNVAGRSFTASASSPNTSLFPAGATNILTSGTASPVYDMGGAVVNVAGPKYRAIGTWDPVAGTGDVAAAVTQAQTDAGTARLEFPAGTYRFASQFTFTVPIKGAGTHATIFTTTALGTGVPAFILNPTGTAAVDQRFPAAEGIQFKGPGSYSLGNKVAGVDGVRIDTKTVLLHCSVQFFDSNIVFNSATGHITLNNVVSTNGYYNVYQLLGNQDHLLIDCDLTGANFASFAAPGNVQVNRVTFLRTHLGYSPYCLYQETNATAAIFLIGVTIIASPMEATGNNGIFSENIGQAGVAGFAGLTWIDPSFSFSNTYKIAARPQDWAVNVGNVALTVTIINGANRLTNGSSGAVQVNANTGSWNIYGDNASDVYTIPNSKWVNRWGSASTPVLGILGSQRIAIGDNGGINDLIITDTTAIAGFTLTGSGGSKGQRVNGTTMEWLNSALNTVILSLLDTGTLLVKNLRLTRQVPTEVVLVSGVDAASGDFMGTITLTAARVVGAPLNPLSGQRIVFSFLQDGTGGWNLTWNVAFKTAFVNTGNTANKRTAVAFVYDNFNWIQDPMVVNAWV